MLKLLVSLVGQLFRSHTELLAENMAFANSLVFYSKQQDSKQQDDRGSRCATGSSGSGSLASGRIGDQPSSSSSPRRSPRGTARAFASTGLTTRCCELDMTPWRALARTRELTGCIRQPALCAGARKGVSGSDGHDKRKACWHRYFCDLPASRA